MNSGEMYWVGGAIQFVKSLPLTGRLKAWQQPLSLVLLIGISAGAYWLAVPDSLAHGAREFINGALGWLGPASIGQIVTSGLAQGAVALGADPNHAAIPVTNK